MTRLKLLLLPALLTATAAHATLIDARFTGIVTQQAGAANPVGSTITGEFVFDTITRLYNSFTIAGRTPAAGFASSASLTPDQFSAFYRAQLSPLNGGTLNSTFLLDLEGLNKFPFGDPALLLANPAQTPGNLDLASNPNSVSPSNFGYNISSADGGNVQRVSANLTAITVGVPEPATLALLGGVTLGLAALRRRA